MAISGRGIQEDPWIVHDWEEFVTAVGTAQNNSYIELGNDIDAPDESTGITIKYSKVIDGKGFAINNPRTTGNTSFFDVRSPDSGNNFFIRNLSFRNINHDSSAAFIYIHQSYYKNHGLENIDFAGYFTDGFLIETYTGGSRDNIYVNRMSTNLEVSNSSFCICKPYNESASYGTDEFKNLNCKIKYINCSPSRALFVKQSNQGRQILQYSTLRLYLEDTETKLDIGADIRNCYIIGKGSGIIVPACSGVSVVENTLPLETSLSNVYSLLTADMKNPQELHDDYSFPAGVN